MSFLDLPAILSEDYCGFLDPREKVWKGESGKGYYLENLVHGCLQALEPFDGIFGFSKRVPQYIGQTLFRFPLRNRASALSSEVYTVQKLEKLLELLKEEAQYLLIFLRSVCAIEVYRITEKNETLSIFSVSVSQKDYQKRSSKQKQLLAQVKSTFSSSYPHEIIMDSSRFTLEVVVNGSIASKHELLVVNQVGSVDNVVMRLAKKQHVLPWVGTAVELTPSDSSGRVFCVLPLPIEDRTPFCVHVNGTFAVSSNRRSLKWEAQERKGDEESTWNKLLIEECISACYFTLITELMELPNIDPSTVYSCWPVLQKVNDTPWNGLLEPFYELLLYNDKAVHCALEDSQWISIEDSVIIPDNEAVYPIIKQVVLNCGVNLVELESNQCIALNKYYDENIQHLTPSKVRNTLKKKLSAYNQLSAHDKMVILQYCLADNCFYANLIGLELLPLANGVFKTFAKINRLPSQSSYVYICSPAAPVSLLPDVKHKLINVHNRYPNIHRNLIRISKHDYSMVKQLTPGVVSNLLLKCKTNEWSSKQMKLFWNWLQDKDLSNFQSRKIVPTKHHATKSVNIVPLTKGNSVVYVSQNIPLPLLLVTGFEKCGIKFANAHEFSYLSHSQIGQYLYCFKPNQVLDAITLINVDNIKFSNNEAIAIQNLFSMSNFNDSRLATISRLPLFKVLQNVELVRTSINAAKTSNSNNKAIAMKGSYNFKTDLLSNEPLIVEGISNNTKLLKKLESIVCFMSETDYLQKVAFVQIENQMFESSDIVPFMQSVLDNFYSPTYKQVIRQLTKAMKTLPFVRISSTKTLEAPCNLFDPENEMLLDLFFDENKFPASNFHLYLPILRQCGLRSSVTSSEILHIIQLNQATVVINHIKVNFDHVKYCKVVAALKYLVKHPNLLSDNVHVGQNKHGSLLYTLQKQASHYCWLPVASNPPNSYPSCLAWKGSQYPSSLASASAHPLVVLSNDLASSKFPLIIGSQAVFIENVPTELANHLRSSSKYLTQAVATHFKLVTEKCEEMSAEKLKAISMQTYNFLLRNINNFDAQMLGDKWIWLKNVSSFVAPTQVAIAANPSFRASLEPYVFVLPPNLQKFSQLFTKCGVSPTITTSQILSVLKSLKDTPAGSQLMATEAWSIVTSILTWLAEDTERINEDNFLVPVESSLPYPQFYPKDKVSYTDNEMLRNIANASEEEYHLIHPKVSHLAPILGLTPFSDKLDITEDIFEDAGQHEPLTTRLSNILKEYQDGLTIIKEMIQNADDAGATEVNILYDSRTHSTDNLLFKGMAESHGPALIVHNNSTFTEEDFENITKLAGATKANQPLKIGKFGVGFCSVYHITDVPSFVSGEWLYIFDPTLKYLKGVVHDESKPGKKVKYRSKYLARSQQLAPYKNLFGFSASSNYNGTMFRLPFRSSASQISSTLYNDFLIKQMKDNLQSSASNLLLFLQNIDCITFGTVKGSDNPVVEIAVKRSVTEDSEIRQSLVSVDVSCLCESRTEYWLVSSITECPHDANNVAVASVACELLKKDSCYHYKRTEGKVFCFLPLSVPSTGLPVHVSANFAVMSNRSGIWTGESSEIASHSRERWNQHLMTTVIPKAYCNLLLKLQEMSTLGRLALYNFCSLWPLSNSLKMKYPWESLIPVLFELMSHESLFYSSSSDQWLTLAQSQFLPLSLFQAAEGEIYSLIEATAVLNLPVVVLPGHFLQQIQNVLSSAVSIITDDEFAENFLISIQLFNNKIIIRNNVLLIILSALGLGATIPVKYKNVKNLLKKLPCVPSSPEGVVLKIASQLVDPLSFSDLFDAEDGMFPLDSFYDNTLVHEAIVRLGLMSQQISGSAVIASARTIESLYDKNKEKALKRVKAIVTCFAEKKAEVPPELNGISFLPVLPKPDDYVLPWKGEGLSLLSPDQAVCDYRGHKTLTFTVGSQRAIVNTESTIKGGCGYIPQRVLKSLGIDIHPSFNDVLSQFEALIGIAQSPGILNKTEQYNTVEAICQHVYEFFEDSLDETVVFRTLSDYCNRPFIWMEKCFVSPCDVAENWKHEHGPYLYKLPSLLSRFPELLKCLKIKKNFNFPDLIDALHRMYTDFLSHEIPEEYQVFTNGILTELNSVTVDLTDITNEVILVDESYTLRPVDQLSFNDAPWLPSDSGTNFIHSALTRKQALALGVKPIRSKFLNHFCSGANQSFSGVPFGQKEKLTQRIKNVLWDYPFDVTFLKELLQNADDAKANEMIVILDKRQHGKERVLSKEWGEELQGPALLVWNDRNFTDKDLEGIQRLGLGSKRDDVDSIGQFGIGFNVVYHLTDCPSFITRGNTLCVFDPHCRYVPGADIVCPGRQYDVDDTFWSNMSDLRSCFLQDNLENKPPGLDKGVLFRFPLRCTKEQVMLSELIDEKERIKPLTANAMEAHLKAWVSIVKDSLLFLNHIIYFKYYVIDKTGTFKHQTSYSIHLNGEDYHKRNELSESLSKFKETKVPFLTMYPLTLETKLTTQNSTTERWLIQQGVGDIQDWSKHWTFLDNILPKHGIAATLTRSSDFDGLVFCFLPLKITSNLPIHINGQFFVNSNRQSLWVSTTDDKGKWNNSIIEAIASSYVHLLEQAKPFYTRHNGYEKLDHLFSDVNAYYSLFPFWNPRFHFQAHKKGDTLSTYHGHVSSITSLPKEKTVDDWKGISSIVLQLLCAKNASILASVSKKSDHSKPTKVVWLVEWHVLQSENSFEQAYFLLKVKSAKSIKSILTKLNMTITCAPNVLYEHLKKIDSEKLANITPQSVFKFYSTFFSRIISEFPCLINETPFESVDNFSLLVQYMLIKSSDDEYSFPASPVGIPLLLTADNQLRLFESPSNIILSNFSCLFPQSLFHFVHDSLIPVFRDKVSYFNPPEEIPIDFIFEVMFLNYPKLRSNVVDNSKYSIIKLKELESL